MSECSNRRALRRDKLDEGRNLAVRDGCAHVVYLQGTPEEQRACTPDVFRLCSGFISGADAIATCLPFFALRNVSRELGPGRLNAMLFGTTTKAPDDR
jgi:hypothetical protein